MDFYLSYSVLTDNLPVVCVSFFQIPSEAASSQSTELPLVFNSSSVAWPVFRALSCDMTPAVHRTYFKVDP